MDIYIIFFFHIMRPDIGKISILTFPYTQPFLFQHDCVPVDKARSINTWFDKFDVEELQWPAQSPDLNSY